MEASLVVLMVFALGFASSRSTNQIPLSFEPVVPYFNPQTRITNGKPVSITDYPYQVGINIEGGWCGGSLISPTFVLTAAQCVKSVAAGNIIVYLGSAARQEGTRRVGKKTIVHPEWNRLYMLNDIALIQIDAVQYSKSIKNVALPPISGSYSTYSGSEAIATGWGKTSDSSGVSSTLQGGTLKIIENSVCAKEYGPTIKPSHVCVSTLDKISTCNGDSGGPLVLKKNKVLVGITSFGSQVGCTKALPVGFTRVTSYRQWIKDHTGA